MVRCPPWSSEFCPFGRSLGNEPQLTGLKGDPSFWELSQDSGKRLIQGYEAQSKLRGLTPSHFLYDQLLPTVSSGGTRRLPEACPCAWDGILRARPELGRQPRHLCHRLVEIVILPKWWNIHGQLERTWKGKNIRKEKCFEVGFFLFCFVFKLWCFRSLGRREVVEDGTRGMFLNFLR